jgi:predicted Rossmann-fold nucleotide-binding protein
MRVLVCGGRHFGDQRRLYAVLDQLHAERGFALVIAGGARGADTLAEEWAKAVALPCRVLLADWAGLSRKAGRIRNEQMLSQGQPHLVVAFPGGRGTAHMVGIARAAGLEVIEIP